MSNNVIEILITGGTLDLFGDEPISLKLSNSSIKDITQRKSNFSQTFTLPGTKNNNQLFNNIFEIGSDSTFNPNLKTSVTILLDTIEVMSGNLQLTNVNIKDNNNIIYEVVIFGEQNDLITNIGDKYLEDIDLTSLDHTLNLPTVINTWTGNNNYYYPLIDYGYDLKWDDINGSASNPSGFTITKMYPAIKAKYLLDSIITDAGYTYSSSFLSGATFDGLYIPYNGVQNGGMSDTFVSNNSFQAGLTTNLVFPLSAYTYFGPFGGQNEYEMSSIVQADTDSTGTNFDLGGNYSTTNFIYTADTSLSIRFGVNYDYSATTFSAITSVGTIGAQFFRSSYMGGTQPFYKSYISSPPYVGPVITLTPYLNQPLSLTAYPAQSGETFWARFIHKIRTSTAKYAANPSANIVRIYSSNFKFFGEASSERVQGANIVMNEMIPQKIKQIDYLKSIILMFNLIVDVDKEDNKKLIIEPRDVYYSGGTVKDWSDKLDLSKDVTAQLISSLQPKRSIYTYKADKDYLNTFYTESKNRIYGDYIYDNVNEFNKEEKKIEVIFSPTPCDNIMDIDNIIVPKIGKVNTSGSFGATDSNIRILQKSLVTFSDDPINGAHLVFDGLNYGGKYPCLNHLNHPLTGTTDINFGTNDYIYWNLNEITQNNLINTYWKKTLDELTNKNAKLITCYLKLTPQDINTFKFNDNIFIDGLTSDGGHYFKVNSIDYIPTSQQTYKVELIKTEEITIIAPVVKKLYNKISDPITFTNRNSLTLGTSYNYGYNNVVVGTNNSVARSSSGILVVGDNNVIENNTNNITVLGNNMTITGGTSGTTYMSDLVLSSGGTINGVALSAVTGLWTGGTGVDSIQSIGGGNIASGDNSFAIGYQTLASGEFSHSEGYQTTASDFGGHAEGSNTTANGDSSHAEGYGTIASGDFSHAEGESTTASGNNSHSEGGNTRATGYTAHAEGLFTYAYGDASHTEGNYTTAIGIASHAEGVYSLASGDWSHAEGYGSTASGILSHAEGNGTTASGDNSHAGGYGANATRFNEWARGGGINSQFGMMNYYTFVTNATPTEIFLGDGTGSKRFIIEASGYYKVKITGIIENGTSAKEVSAEGLIKNVAGTTSLVGTFPTVSTNADVSMATATITVSADNTNDSLKIDVTGLAAGTTSFSIKAEYIALH